MLVKLFPTPPASYQRHFDSDGFIATRTEGEGLTPLNLT